MRGTDPDKRPVEGQIVASVMLRQGVGYVDDCECVDSFCACLDNFSSCSGPRVYASPEWCGDNLVFEYSALSADCVDNKARLADVDVSVVKVRKRKSKIGTVPYVDAEVIRGFKCMTQLEVSDDELEESRMTGLRDRKRKYVERDDRSVMRVMPKPPGKDRKVEVKRKVERYLRGDSSLVNESNEASTFNLGSTGAEESDSVIAVNESGSSSEIERRLAWIRRDANEEVVRRCEELDDCERCVLSQDIDSDEEIKARIFCEVLSEYHSARIEGLIM